MSEVYSLLEGIIRQRLSLSLLLSLLTACQRPLMPILFTSFWVFIIRSARTRILDIVYSLL